MYTRACRIFALVPYIGEMRRDTWVEANATRDRVNANNVVLKSIRDDDAPKLDSVFRNRSTADSLPWELARKCHVCLRSFYGFPEISNIMDSFVPIIMSCEPAHDDRFTNLFFLSPQDMGNIKTK